MSEWQYLIQLLAGMTTEQQGELFDRYGRRGWELVNVVVDPNAPATSYVATAYFKRPREANGPTAKRKVEG